MLLLVACVLDPTDSEDVRTCDDVLADYAAEAANIQSCTDWSECGQVLTGTSCGCTRNWVARTDADTTTFYTLQAEAADAECELGGSTCDCPEAYGFDCVDAVCTWDYTTNNYGIPDCDGDRGAAMDINSASVVGDELILNVSYGGGCEDHTFTLCWPDQSFMESDPVQAGFEVYHEDNDDPCDAWFTEDQAFNLAPLRTAYEAMYGSGSASIILDVGGFSVEYAW